MPHHVNALYDVHRNAVLLPAALPFTELLTSAAQPLPAAYRERGRTCRTFSPIGSDRHSRWLRDKHAPVLLRRARGAILSRHSTRFSRALHLLHGDYRPPRDDRRSPASVQALDFEALVLSPFGEYVRSWWLATAARIGIFSLCSDMPIVSCLV